MNYIEEIEQHRPEIAALCERLSVARLDLIGSAASGNFDTMRSDVDFLVEFRPLQPVDHADSYFSLLAQLQDIFQRPVDLIETTAVRNPHFLESVRHSRILLYAA